MSKNLFYYECCSSMNALEEFSYQISRSSKNESSEKSTNLRNSTSKTCLKSVENSSIYRHCPMGRICTNSQKSLYLSLCVLVLLISMASGKCYTTKPGLTIAGAEYRKEYELRYDQCGRACFNDVSCMAFEWRKEDGECILKAKSLNGTFTDKSGVQFGLCLDRADPENMRDLFYDHEFGGLEYASTINVPSDECPGFCMENAKEGSNFAHLSYSWRPNDPKNPDETEGNCVCVATLHYVKLRFGSLSAYLK